MPNVPSFVCARLCRLVIVLPLLFIGLGAHAGETVVEPLDGVRKYASMWPGGTFEIGNDAGFSWGRVITDGNAGATFIANVRPFSPLIDASGKFVKIRIKVDNVSRLSGLEFRMSSDRFNSNYYAFSFGLYDDRDFNVVRDGVWTTLTFSFGDAQIEGKPDRSQLNSIGWYLADKGEGAPITAYWGGLSLVDEPKEGVVSITFDDGYSGNLKAAEMMSKHGFRGTAYIIPGAIGQTGYLTHHQLVDMQLRYGWDIAAHHQTPFTDIPPEELENTILGIQRFLFDNGFQSGAGHLAYPLGRQNTSLVRPLVRKYFATARVAGEGPETLPPADPHLLRAYNVTNETTPAQIGEAARRARDNKEWLILMLHYLVEEADTILEYSLTDFEQMLVELEKSKVKVVPLADVYEACGRGFSGPTPTADCDFSQAVAAPRP